MKSSSLTIFTTNGVAKYSNSLPISLQGNEVSNVPFLAISPTEVDFGGFVIGSPGAATGLDSSFIISNVGLSPLTITGYGYTTDTEPPVQYTNVTFGAESKIGENFTSVDLPAVGSEVPAGKSLTIPIRFKANETGSYQNILQVWSDGGNKNVLFTASASKAPIAELSVETSEHGWDVDGVMDFGDVLAGTIMTRRIRICNKGGSALLITKSKPPIQTELQAENPVSDLHEGQTISVNDCAYGPIDIAASPEPPNVPDHTVSDSWVLNTDDLTFGVHDVKIQANIISRKVGPTKADGSPIYRYLGCYFDASGRQLQTQFELGTANENDACQKKCYGLNYKFAGTEYHTQCWCGNNSPSDLKFFPESAKRCTFGCSKDASQACGGNGGYISVYYDDSNFTPNCTIVPCSSVSPLSSPSSTRTSSVDPTIPPTTSNTLTTVVDPRPPTTTTPTTPPRASSPTTATSVIAGFRPQGCIAEPLNHHAMLQLAANDSMSVEFCIARARDRLAAKPATTYRYLGVEYGRECFGATAPVPSQTSLVGNMACSLACSGAPTEKCGGRAMYNFYVSTDVAAASTSLPVSTTGTV